MSGKDGNADKEVPSSSRKTPLLGARGLYIKSGCKVASLCKLMRVGVFPVHQRSSNWVLENHSQSNHNKPKGRHYMEPKRMQRKSGKLPDG